MVTKKKTVRRTAPKPAGPELNPAMLRWMNAADENGLIPTRTRNDTQKKCIDAAFVVKINKEFLLTDTGKAAREFFGKVRALLEGSTFPLPRALARLLA